MQHSLEGAIGNVEIGVAVEDKKDRIELIARPSQRAGSALRFRFDRYAERRAAYHAPFIPIGDLFAEVTGKQQDSIKSLPRDIIDQQIKKNPIRADLHERFWSRARQFMKAGTFSADQYHRLTYATGR